MVAVRGLGPLFARGGLPVNKVSVEKVWVGLGRHTIQIKDVQQVVKLTMHVTTVGRVEHRENRGSSGCVRKRVRGLLS